MTKEMNNLGAWLQMEKDLEDALQMLNEQNYGLLRTCLTSLRTVARSNREAAQQDLSRRE